MDNCDGNKCKDCPYCGKNRLYDDIITAKWRKGLSVAIAGVLTLSVIADVFMLARLFT